jgi:hypothetical protein
VYEVLAKDSGAETGVFAQRIPIPIGMWQPFSNRGVPVRLTSGGLVPIVGERALILICYEAFLNVAFIIFGDLRTYPSNRHRKRVLGIRDADSRGTRRTVPHMGSSVQPPTAVSGEQVKSVQCGLLFKGPLLTG